MPARRARIPAPEDALLNEPARIRTCQAATDLDDPLALLCLPEADQAPGFFWFSPETGRGLSGFGAVHEARASGPTRLQSAALALAQARATFDPSSAEGIEWVGGFAFEPRVDRGGAWRAFPATWFALPWAAVRTTGEARAVCCSGCVEPGELVRRTRGLEARLRTAETPGPWVPSRGAALEDTWSRLTAAASMDGLRRRIERALAAIENGSLRKVVVATRRTVRLAHRIDVLALLTAVRDAEPQAYHFLVRPRPGYAFLGATPERLLRLEGREAWVTALAGSTPRHPEPGRDEALAAALLASPKERVEHGIVTETVRGTLEAAGYRIEREDGPTLRRLSRVQHLETTIQAHSEAPGDVLALADRLHPTPALGGVPRDVALALIAELEPEPRGWYGGALGCVDGRGNGELAVAIRALLVQEDTVTAWAGAGIVAGSDPDAEAAEMHLKLASTLAPVLG